MSVATIPQKNGSFLSNLCIVKYGGSILLQDSKRNILKTVRHLQKMQIVHTETAVMAISSSRIVVTGIQSENLRMVHNIKRISHAICDPTSKRFAIIARNSAQSTESGHFCHFFSAKTKQQIERINDKIKKAFEEAIELKKLKDVKKPQKMINQNVNSSSLKSAQVGFLTMAEDSKNSLAYRLLLPYGQNPSKMSKVIHFMGKNDCNLRLKNVFKDCSNPRDEFCTMKNSQKSNDFFQSTDSFIYHPADSSQSSSNTENHHNVKKSHKFLKFFKRKRVSTEDSGRGTLTMNPKTFEYSNKSANYSSVASELYEWYQPNISRNVATEKLMGQKIGDFLIRRSNSVDDALALSVRLDFNQVGHYLIVQNSDGGLSFEGLDKTWPTLPKLVECLKILSDTSMKTFL